MRANLGLGINHNLAASVNPIRPSVAPYAPQAAQPQDAAKLAAARAFFAAALGQVSNPSSIGQATAAAVTAAATGITPPPESPAKIPRPGSLIDIRV